MKEFFQLLILAGKEFVSDNAMKLSASLSYYTLFSMAPMLIIVIAVSSVVLGKEAVEGYLFQQFEDIIGPLGAMQLQEMIRNVNVSNDTPWVAAIGIVTLIIGATGVFVEIQDSVNAIWSIKVKVKHSWLKFLKNRLLSFSMVVGIGFLLLVTLTVSSLLSMLYDRLSVYFGQAIWVAWILTNTITTATVLSLFAIIFKVLPDAKLKWRDVLVGAFFTAILFLAGKYLINIYLSKSSTVSAYGAAGAVVLIILWIYYSSAILFFGAEFTKVYADKYGGRILPNSYAVFIEEKEVSLQHAPTPDAVKEEQPKQNQQKKHALKT